jgi:hypothetical protein
MDWDLSTKLAGSCCRRAAGKLPGGCCPAWLAAASQAAALLAGSSGSSLHSTCGKDQGRVACKFHHRLFHHRLFQ